MSVTDADQMAEVAWRLLDDTILTSGLWTVAEVASYFNQRQNRFNAATNLMLAHQPLAFLSGVSSGNLPPDWIATLRATWRAAGSSVMSPVTKSDRYAASLGIQTWNAPLVPTLFDDNSGGPLKVELFPPPLTDGAFEILYTSVLEILHFDPNTPDVFDVPDDFVPYITYGVLADMLSKDGRGRNLEKAAYCEERFAEGIALAGILLTGFL